MAILILTRTSAARLAHYHLLARTCRSITFLSPGRIALPSFTHISRRFDHALASRKNEPRGAFESTAASDSPDTSPQLDFSTLRTKVSRDTLRAITDKPFNHVHMSTVQAAVLPLLPELARPYSKDESHGPPRDLLVKAKTGTGKTLAFLVPAIEARIKAINKAGVDALEKNGGQPDAHVVEDAKRKYARQTVGTVVISPTRELATQIAQEAIKLTHWHKGFEVKLFTGGSSKWHQLRDFKHGRNDIVVATPGRIRDVLENDPDVSQVLRTAPQLVLDEADTLLDMGFRPDIDAIVDFFPKMPKRQTFLFSATVSPAIRQIAREVLHKDHTFIDVVPKDESPVHAHIPQHFTVVPDAREQLPYLFRLIAHDQLANPGSSKIMVFLNTTKQTQLFTTLLREVSKNSLPARTRIYEIHSKRSQHQRSTASDAFRRDRSGAAILVTSDVSARGIDYPGVTRVIQVGIPGSTEQYIHRIGRTGRAGKDGRADLILLPFEQTFVRYQLSDVPIKELSHSRLLNETTALAEKFEADPAAFWKSVKAVDPRAQELINQDHHFSGKPSTAIAQLNTEISGLLDQVDREAISEVFISLLGYYFARANDMRVTRRSVYEALQAWTTEACGLPEAPFVSNSLLARLGGLDGGPPARSAHRGPLRRSFGFKSPSTRYTNSERNRLQNEQTDRGFAHGRHREHEWKSGGSRWSGRGSRMDGEGRKSGKFGRSHHADDLFF
ncbi:P-loop containing nucleoside triphosphate hydrolase protein [Lactifluus volemus]|nr:P-loop containing nucleoside triphosphate hydrolase protein [Lactifluus volemus]